jgi:hypothetical protein
VSQAADHVIRTNTGDADDARHRASTTAATMALSLLSTSCEHRIMHEFLLSFPAALASVVGHSVCQAWGAYVLRGGAVT